jgi:hypothetical protein
MPTLSAELGGRPTPIADSIDYVVDSVFGIGTVLGLECFDRFEQFGGFL